MINLFNLDINKIKHNGSEVVLMKLNGDIIYEPERGFCIEYTVIPTDLYLDDTDIEGTCCYGLPRIYSEDSLLFGGDGTYSFNYSRILITKTDGTKTNNPRTKCNEIAKVTLWYPETTQSLKFFFPYSSNNNQTAVKEVNYCNTSNFVSMEYMFYSCESLTAINNISKWDTSNVTNMRGLFSQCGEQKEIDVRSFNTSKVTDMREMFYNCSSLTSLDVSNFDTSEVATMSSMFNNCSSLTELDLSGFDTSNVNSVMSMFKNCTSLELLNLSNFDISKAAIGPYGVSEIVSDMFNNCTSLHKLRLDNCNNETLKRIINYGNLPINIIDGVTRTIYCKKSQLSGVIRPTNWVYSYVSEDPNTPDIDIPDVPEVQYFIEYTVDNNSTNLLNGGDTDNIYCYGLPRIYTDSSSYGYYNYAKIEITKVDGSVTTNTLITCDKVAKVKLWYPEDTYAIKFYGSSSYISEVKTIKFYNTPKLKSATNMFFYCEKLTSLDLSKWDIGYLTGHSDLQLMLGLNMPLLTDFYPPKNIHADINVSGCPSLTATSLNNVVTNLATVSSYSRYILTLGTVNANKLSGWNTIDAAKNKGWTVY